MAAPKKKPERKFRSSKNSKKAGEVGAVKPV